MAGRRPQMYRVDVDALLQRGLVSQHYSIEGTAYYRARGKMEDVLYGLGRQSDRVNEYDVRPGTLHKLAMMDGITTDQIARFALCDKRQAQRYMRKLKTLEAYCNRWCG